MKWAGRKGERAAQGQAGGFWRSEGRGTGAGRGGENKEKGKSEIETEI